MGGSEGSNGIGKNILDASGSNGLSFPKVRSEVERLADAIISRPNRGKHVAAISVYGDESSGSHVFALSVYIGTVGRWAEFESKWKTVLSDAGLRDENGELLPFHMADFESRFPPFDWNNDKRIDVLQKLVRVIHEAELTGLSCILPLELFRRGIPVNSHLPIDHPLRRILQYMICFYALHVPLLQVSFHCSEPIPFVLDRNELTAGMVQSVIDGLHRKYPEMAKLMDTPVFRDKKLVVPLQAADIWAYESMKHHENLISKSNRKTRKSYELLTSSGQYRSYVCDPGFIKKLAAMSYGYALDNGLID
jgi:hypothetical protein